MKEIEKKKRRGEKEGGERGEREKEGRERNRK